MYCCSSGPVDTVVAVDNMYTAVAVDTIDIAIAVDTMDTVCSSGEYVYHSSSGPVDTVVVDTLDTAVGCISG